MTAESTITYRDGRVVWSMSPRVAEDVALILAAKDQREAGWMVDSIDLLKAVLGARISAGPKS